MRIRHGLPANLVRTQARIDKRQNSRAEYHSRGGAINKGDDEIS